MWKEAVGFGRSGSSGPVESRVTRRVVGRPAESAVAESRAQHRAHRKQLTCYSAYSC